MRRLYGFLFFIAFFGVFCAGSIAAVVPVEKNPQNVAINKILDIAVAANVKSDSVSIIDLKTQAVVKTVPVGGSPSGVAIDEELNIAVVTNSKDNTASIVDLKTNAVISTVPVGKCPLGVAVDSNAHTAIVANNKDDSISIIDLKTFTLLDTLFVGQEPIDVAVDPELRLALVLNQNGYSVSVIDLKTNEVMNTVPVGKRPIAIDINPETHLAAVANEKDNSITVIDLDDFKAISIPVCKHPLDITVKLLDNRALVICDEDRNLLLIDLNTNEVVKNYGLEKLPRGIAVNPHTNVAAVTDDKSDSLTLIQLPNPKPRIDKVEPEKLNRGSKDIILAVEGAEFIKTTTASFKSETASYGVSPIFIDNRHIEIAVPDGMLNNTGDYKFTLSNPSPEGGASNEIEIKVENPVPQIALLEPSEATAGSPVNLTIHGVGFFDETGFRIDGEPTGSTYISYRKAALNLNPSLLEYGRYLNISAYNPTPGGGASGGAVFTVLNPLPSLSSISPAFVAAGSPDLVLTLSGNNFVKTSKAKFDTQELSTTYVSGTELKATVSSSMLASPGDYQVKVVNPVPGGGESGSVVLKAEANKPKITKIESCYYDRRSGEICTGEFSPGQYFLKATGENFKPDTVFMFGIGGPAYNVTGYSYANPNSVSFYANFPSGGVYVFTASNGMSGSEPYIVSIKNPTPYAYYIDPSVIAATNAPYTAALYGYGFMPTSSVAVDGIQTAYSYRSPNTLYITLPVEIASQVGTHTVTVTNLPPGGGSSNPTSLTVTYPFPAISSIEPPIAPANAAIEVVLYGSLFMETSTVEFNGQAIPFTYINSNTLKVEIPGSLIPSSGYYGFRVINPSPSGSSGYIYLVVQNPVPVISGLTPSEADEGNDVEVYITGTGFLPDTNVRIDATYGSYWNAATTYIDPEHLKATVSKFLLAGTHTISAFNFMPGGGYSNMVAFTLFNPAPSLTSISPNTVVEGTTDLSVTLIGDFDKSSVVYFEGIQLQTSYNSQSWLSAVIPADYLKTPGDYQIKVVNPPPGGGESVPLTFTVKPNMTVEITSLKDGDQTDNSATLVKGTFTSTTADIGITVNGVIADIFGNEWVANGVPLKGGENVIEAVIADASGKTFADGITVSSTGAESPIKLSSNVTSGLGTLQVYFSIDALASYSMDYEGDGIIDAVTTMKELSRKYYTPGIYYPTVSYIDQQGNVYSDTIAITVVSKEEIDILLKDKWEGMKGKLAEGDVDGAVKGFIGPSQGRYSAIFTHLVDQLPYIANDLKTIQLVHLEDGLAEYRVKRMEGTTVVTYYVYFMKDETGIWKIKQF